MFKKGERQPGQGAGGGAANGRLGGRPTNEERAIRESFRQALERELQANAKMLSKEYIKFAKTDAATCRHAVDKALPPVEKVEHSGSVIFKTNVLPEED